uniref:Uncharacterized protein n=1 Tax=Octopus bimaculoides TaxID=37653 RepID=A0A0L8GP33_OCTBM
MRGHDSVIVNYLLGLAIYIVLTSCKVVAVAINLVDTGTTISCITTVHEQIYKINIQGGWGGRIHLYICYIDSSY